jgi:small-conductance mechanosensitive channel
MQKNGWNLLDQFEDEEVSKWFHHWSIVYGPILVLCIGMVFRIQHWPGASLIISASLLLILVRSFIFFFTKKRLLYEWLYFIGRITLIIALAINFGFIPLQKTVMLTVLGVFSLGVLAFVFRKRTPADDEPEKQEDDY